MSALPDLKPQPLAQDQWISSANQERLKAAGYGSLALISAIAILALTTTLCFFGFGFAMAPFYDFQLSWGIDFLVHLIGITSIAGPVTSILPIKFISCRLFNTAMDHWQKGSELATLAAKENELVLQ